MELTSLALPFRRVLATNSTSTAFPSRVPQVAEPLAATTGFEGVIDLFSRTHGVLTFPRSGAPVNALFLFFGQGNANDTFDARIYGWRRAANDIGDLWVPVLLAEVTCTLGAMTGVDTYALDNSDKIVDTIAAAAWVSDNVEVTSPAGDLMAHLMLDAKGFEKLEVVFDRTGATECNALASML